MPRFFRSLMALTRTGREKFGPITSIRALFSSALQRVLRRVPIHRAVLALRHRFIAYTTQIFTMPGEYLRQSASFPVCPLLLTGPNPGLYCPDAFCRQVSFEIPPPYFESRGRVSANDQSSRAENCASFDMRLRS